MDLNRALYNISALADLSREVTSEKHFVDTIRSVLYVVMGTFLASKGAVLSREKETAILVPTVWKGFEAPDLNIGAREVETLGKSGPFIMSDPAVPASLRHTLLKAGVGIFIPLRVRDECIGLLALSNKFTSEAYSDADLEILRVVANQIAITLKNHTLFMDLSEQLEKNRKLYEEMRLIYHDTIQAFAAAIDAKDVYTRNHSHRVAKYAVAVARELGWSEPDIEGLYIAGFLHDVGKIIIRDEILNKKEGLTEKEFDEIRSHPVLSSNIISKIKFPWKDVVNMIRHHHERLDGTGYPSALTGEELSEGAKILTLADSFDAMTSDRPYRNRLELGTALEELKNCRGTQFDSRIVATFCKVLEREIRGELAEPNILPHLDNNFDPSVITALLEVIIKELST